MAELQTKLTTSIPKLSAIIPRGDDTFESVNVADRMGNLAPIAYGGSTLAFAINCASATVKTTHHRRYRLQILIDFEDPVYLWKPDQEPYPQYSSRNMNHLLTLTAQPKFTLPWVTFLAQS